MRIIFDENVPRPLLRTADKNLRYQQSLIGRTLAIVELPTNRLPILVTLATEIVSAVTSAAPGSYIQVPLPGSTP